ncbi:hypothetical protein FGO68_gene3549 [Halteria grandinella]|uniref:Uncharacterized protein n=1 Tax=Halteria grandinella TaxID=5974 RepID=A0A8J8T914_HALGN|nr:hypothetical protein FGO68_gene3549 [Halteria grandinella]
MTLVVVNSAIVPKFSSQPPELNVKVGENVIKYFPAKINFSATDTEEAYHIQSYGTALNLTPLPGTFSSILGYSIGQLSFHPPGTNAPQTFFIQVILKDSSTATATTNTYCFQVNILNEVPEIDPAFPLSNQIIQAGSSKIFKVRGIDPESQSLTYAQITTLDPFYGSFIAMTQTYTFNPGALIPDTQFVVTFSISDGYNNLEFSFMVMINNDPPYFSTPLYDQSSYCESVSEYIIPNGIDPEGGGLISYRLISGPIIYVNFEASQRKFTFFPTGTDCPGSIKLTIELSDSLYSIQSTFTLYLYNGSVPIIVPPVVNIEENQNLGPPVFIGELQPIVMTIGQTHQYYLPKIADPDGDLYNISLIVPNNRFKSALKLFYFKKLLLFPIEPNSHLGNFTVILSLKDNNSHPLTQHFVINVTVNPKEIPIIIEEKHVIYETEKDIQAYGLQHNLTVNEVRFKSAKVNQRGKANIEIQTEIMGVIGLINN